MGLGLDAPWPRYTVSTVSALIAAPLDARTNTSEGFNELFSSRPRFAGLKAARHSDDPQKLKQLKPKTRVHDVYLAKGNTIWCEKPRGGIIKYKYQKCSRSAFEIKS